MVSLYGLSREMSIKWKDTPIDKFRMIDFVCDLESNRIIDIDFDIHATKNFFTDERFECYYIAFRLITKELFLNNIFRIGYCNNEKYNNSNLTKQNETLSNERMKQLLRNQGDLDFITTPCNEGNFLITNKYKNIDLSDISDKLITSDSVRREKDIFDYIHIYKIFDWENNSMLVIGSN